MDIEGSFHLIIFINDGRNSGGDRDDSRELNVERVASRIRLCLYLLSLSFVFILCFFLLSLSFPFESSL